MKQLSIVVPSYNASGTVRQTLDSLCAALRADALEVIAVNDGSTDDTLGVLREYERRFPDTVRVIDKPNGGHGSGVNAGLAIATGRYFGIVDADDWVDTVSLDELLARLADVTDDLILNDLALENSQTGESKPSAYTAALPHDASLPLAELIADDPFHLQTLLARTELLRAVPVRLAEKVFYDDGEFIVQALSTAETVYVSGRVIYHYRYNNAAQSVSEASYLRNRAHLRAILERNLAFRASRTFGAANLARMDAIIVEELRQYVYICRVLNPDRAEGRADARAALRLVPASMPLGRGCRAKLALYALMNRLGMGAKQLRALKRLLGKQGGYWES